jgi:tryptophan-rich sensory protein
MDISSIIVFVGFVGMCSLAALVRRLRKPGLASAELGVPPSLGISLSDHRCFRLAGMADVWFAFPFAIYLVQLILNASWSPIFFGMRRPDLAFIEVVILWLSIIATIAAFHRVNAVAAWLLLPYLAWVTFAAALNLTIWRLNRGPLSRS